ncbi:MAG: two-component system phosphate regulon sensor histidine kinase PhoR [Saprospiraceae bacterium]|jgi:two-component system phosphate regulon sensor histidine kinase PhoR
MKEKNLKILMTVMALAISGLVFVEVFWLNEAIALKEQEFKKNVHKAMSTAVFKLERYESLGLTSKPKKITPSPRQKYLNFQDSLVASNGNFSLTIQEESVFENNKGELVRRTVQTYVDEQGHLVEKTLQEELEIQDQNQKSIINEMVEDFNSFYLKSTAQRIDPHFLNDVVKRELATYGINTKYKLGVIGAHKILLKDKGVDAKDLFSSSYKMKLFPNDFFASKEYLVLYFPQEKGFLLRSLGGVVFVSAIFMCALIVVFWITFTTIIRQKKMAVIKTDFINNMTHELKTPISTISLACEVLNDDSVSKTRERMVHFVNVISEENKRLETLVESVLQTAVLDKGGLKLKKEWVSIHEVIEEVVGKMQVHANQKGGSIAMEFGALEDEIFADKFHLSNVIRNLIDNAIKYSETINVVVRTINVENEMVIEVKDEGIGIAKDDLDKIFDKLYRVPTGNIHNVKGFGLGLNYVKAVIEKHKGTVKVSSKIGSGTVFSVCLPKNIT